STTRVQESRIRFRRVPRCAGEGETLTDGGTVETLYNDRDQPAEAKILDDEGNVVFRILYTYGADGRIALERLTTESLPLPKEFRNQIPLEHREATLTQLKTQLAEISQRTGLGADSERSYVYHNQGHLVARHLRQGPIREDITLRYNEHGDICESVRTAGGFPHPTGAISEPQIESRSEYAYDTHGNWISKLDISMVNENETKHTRTRLLNYFD